MKVLPLPCGQLDLRVAGWPGKMALLSYKQAFDRHWRTLVDFIIWRNFIISRKCIVLQHVFDWSDDLSKNMGFKRPKTRCLPDPKSCFILCTVFCVYVQQGHPTTVFCKRSVRRSKNYLEFSIAWERLKISRWLFHSCTIFEPDLINSLRFS